MIEIDGLTKRYGAFTALDDVSFTCRPGQVTGFLGPNGAGKTTAMRALVGLTEATAGAATIGGRRYRDLPNPGRRVGVLLDAGAQHGGRTGREILTLAALTMGLPRERVEEMLALVSLDDREAGRRLRDYSLGMKQRLGLAYALLGDPGVLVLDEPANGLDPAGIRWMRGLLGGYARDGGTVLLSSHLLHEVEQVADELVLIGRGRVVAQGSPTALLDDGAGASTLVRATDDAALVTALRSAGLEPARDGAAWRVPVSAEQVGAAAREHRLTLTELRSGAARLEDLFLQLTADDQRDAATGSVPNAATTTGDAA